MIREQLILNKIVGKDILDVGSVGQTDTYSLWDEYQQVAYKSLTGIDLEANTNENQIVFRLKRLNKDVRVLTGNIEEYQFDRTFDVIVAGDLIEHLNNQGLFLKNIYKHLKDDGTLIITTPNAKWPTVFLKPNPTHTLWHDKYTLKRLFKMNGFQVKFFRYYYGNKKKYPFFLKPFIWKQAIYVEAKKVIDS